MKKHIISRTLSFLLALTLIFAAAPLSAFGAGTGDESESESATATTYGSMADTLSDLYWLLFVKPFLKPSASGEGLPENAKLSFETVSNPFNRKTGSVNYDFLDFYDIKAVDKQTGKEIHPSGEVEVTVTDARIKDGQSVYILHILDDENVIKNTANYVLKSDPAFVSAFPAAAKAAEKATGKKGVAVEIIDDLTVDGNDITFKTSSFSIFIVTSDPRVTVEFYKLVYDPDEGSAVQLLSSVKVKYSDVTALNTNNQPRIDDIIYDPPIDSTDLGNNVLFKGWSPDFSYIEGDSTVTGEGQNYTTSSAPLTIKNARAAVSSYLEEHHGDIADNAVTLKFYAMLFKQYIISYYDEDGNVCLARDTLEFRVEDHLDGKIDYRVNWNYIPYSEGSAFMGWYVKSTPASYINGFYYTGSGTASSPYVPVNGVDEPSTVSGATLLPELQTEDGIIDNPIWMEIDGDVYLIAAAPTGNWLVFDENGYGATFCASQFVKTDDVTVLPRPEDEMIRFGYTFGGWYDSKEHADAHALDPEDETGKFVFGGTISETTTIYASWIPNTTANYTILIWKQNVTGNGYDFAESTTLVGTVGDNIGGVNVYGTGNGAYVTVNGTAKQYTGFHYDHMDQNVEIKVEGNSILNVYYNRNVVTLNFKVYTTGTNWHETTDVTGEIYGTYDKTTYFRIYTDDGGETWYTAATSEYVETTDDLSSPLYANIDGAYVELSYNESIGWYITNNSQYAANTVGSPKYGYIDGSYTQLTERDGHYYYYVQDTQYVVTTDYSNNGTTRYAILGRTDTQLVDGIYTALNRESGTYFRYRIYTASNANDNNMYGLIDGQYVQLERRGGAGNRTYWYNNVQYTGQRYTRSWGPYTRWDSTTIYIRSTVNVETEYTGTVYTHAIPNEGPYYKLVTTVTTYTGTRYKSEGTGFQTIYTMQGLYGAPLSSSSTSVKAWPTDYWWYEDYDYDYWYGYSGSGTRTTFLDAFLLADGGSEDTFYGFTGTGNSNIYFIKQNSDGTWPANTAYTNVVNVTGGRFYISDKYNGYKAVQYSTNGTSWTNLGDKDPQTGYYGSVSNYTNLYIRFAPLTYSILYMDGQYVDGNGSPVQGYSSRGELHEVQNVPYASDLSSYNEGGTNYYEPEFDSFVFEGWFLDDQCSQAYTFTTMSEGITVYAKWRQVQYRVFLHPNVPDEVTDEMLDWGRDDQAMNFRISVGGKVSTPTAKPANGYEFVGWYLDPEFKHPFDGDSYPFNETSVNLANSYSGAGPYNKATDFTDPMNQRGEIVATEANPARNSDAERFWITKKVDVYGQWRRVLDGADGINIVYDYSKRDDPDKVIVDSDPSTHNISGYTWSDNHIYVDQAITNGAPAAPAVFDQETGKTYFFRYWVIQEWSNSLNGGAGGFTVNVPEIGVEPSLTEEQKEKWIIYPGQEFRVNYSDTRQTVLTEDDPATPENEFSCIYMTRLFAVYTEGEPEQTTVKYNANGGSWVKNDQDEDLVTKVQACSYETVVNGTVTTVTKYYTAKGTDSNGQPEYGFTLIVNEGFNVLVYNNATYGELLTRPGYTFLGWARDPEATAAEFAADGTDPTVAADQVNESTANTLYAVWKVETYTVDVAKVINNLGVADSSWDDHGFRFYYSITDGGDEYNVTDKLVNGETGVSVNGAVTIVNVPYGSTLSVWEVLSVEESAVFTTDHDADHKLVIENVTAEKLANGISITNTRVTGKITVVKMVVDGDGNECGTEFPTEKFIFKLERLNSAGTEVDDTFTAVYFTLYANKSVSALVPAGNYRVTELTEWSWRYDAEDDTTVKKCTIDQDNSTARAEFTNKRNAKNWLSGENSADNTFVVSNGR